MKWSLKVSSKSLRINRDENIFFQSLREFFMKIILFILLIVAIVVIPFKGIAGTFFHNILESFNYPIKDIEVFGNYYVDSKDIIESSGLNLSQNIFNFDKKNIRSLVLQNPLIANVQILRKLPGTIILKVEEKEPAFYVFFNKEERILTTNYEIIKVNLPSKVLDLPILQFDLSLKSDIKDLQGFLVGKEEILDGIKSNFNKDLDSVSEIFFSNNFSKLYLTNNQVITFNNYNENKFFIAKELLKDNNIDNVDLRFKDQIITYNN